MVNNNIEMFLFGNNGTHGINRIEIVGDNLIIDFIVWSDKTLHKIVEFKNVEEISICKNESDELDMPFDIIGIDLVELSNSKWRFCIHCAEIEYLFESEWPAVIQ